VAQETEIGQLVKDAVQYNATDVWFNLMFPGAYAPFLEILCQTWASIESKQWINYQVIQGAGRTDWGGFTDTVYGLGSSDLLSWLPAWYPPPTNSYLDLPTPMEYGSGPYMLTSLSYTSDEWTAVRNPNWWGGAPAFYPTEAGTPPAGYANTIEVSWEYAWTAAQGFFKSGDCDWAALPSLQYIGDIYENGYTGSYYPYPTSSTNYPDAGIRGYANLAELEVDDLFFNYNVSSATTYGAVEAPVTGGAYPAGDSGGIPSNFFGGIAGQVNPYGIDMRKAFAYSIDYAKEITVAALGEAIQPATDIIPGLYGYNSSITGYSLNLALATQYFNDWPGLNTTGFTLDLVYNQGNLERQELCQIIQQDVESINSKYVINVVPVAWNAYMGLIPEGVLSAFVVGWLVDFPDPHDFVVPFYHSYGAFSGPQQYSNPVMDNYINTAITLPNGNARQTLYNEIAALAIADCPSVPVICPTGRHYEFDWVQGWYYNPIYPGINFFNQYKFYYEPEASDSAPSQPHSEYLAADINRDGVVNMKDIASLARAFGSAYTQPIESNWVFVDDIVNIRQVTMRSIAFVARQFGAISPIGTFGPIFSESKTLPPISVSPASYTSGTSVTFTANLLTGYGVTAGRVIQWYYGTLGNYTLAAPTAGPTGPTFTWTIPTGSSYVFCTVTDTFTGSVALARTAAGISNTAVTYSPWVAVYAP